jgi:hypothetical protein
MTPTNSRPGATFRPGAFSLSALDADVPHCDDGSMYDEPASRALPEARHALAGEATENQAKERGRKEHDRSQP